MQPVRLQVGEFVALINQTLEYAYGHVVVAGELANFRVSKNRWVYFDLKDETATMRCFGTVYMLPGPLEDGMLLEVSGSPRLHPQYGFSLTVQTIRPTGEGSIKQAARLLERQLAAEGLFAEDRKRPLPYPPSSVGLITSAASAAYADFCKVLQARWGGVDIDVADVQVQGGPAAGQIIRAIEWFNRQAKPPEVLVLIRGGGSADDLAAFSLEPVVRAVAASRIPTLAAIGHEVDTSLAELAADRRASTPSNAAELLVPDRRAALEAVHAAVRRLHVAGLRRVEAARLDTSFVQSQLDEKLDGILRDSNDWLDRNRSMLRVLNPALALQRGFALVRDAKGYLVRKSSDKSIGEIVSVQLGSGGFTATIETVDPHSATEKADGLRRQSG